MNLALLQWMHLTELEERRVPSYYYSWEGGWQKGWRGGVGLEGIQSSPSPQHPPEAQEGCGLEQMCLEPVCLPCHPSPRAAATPCHLPAKALGLGQGLSCHVELPSPAPDSAELPALSGWGNGRDGERCPPYLRGQIASSCGQIKSDGDRLEEGVCFPCKANSLSLFPARSGSSQAAFWAGNLLCRRGKSSRVHDVRAGT